MRTSDDMLMYNALDSAITKMCCEGFWPEVMDHDYRDTYDFTIRLLDPLMYMMTRGILVDTERLYGMKGTLSKDVEEKQEELNSICGRPLNVNSPKDVQAYFYIEKGIPPYTKRNAGGTTSITTDDKTMQRLARGTAQRPGMREAKLVQEIRGLKKLIGTYLDIELDSDNRFRCSYNPRGTKFGRVSSSKTIFGTGMNMQNLPMTAKSFLVADPGYIMFELDKRQAEWIVVAFLSGDANMMRVYFENKDPHTYTASQMFGVPEELILMENKIVGHESDVATIEELRHKLPDLKRLNFIPRNMSMRQSGKKANHGLNYDEGYRTFALTNEMVEADAKRVINFYHSIYPGIRQWYQAVQTQLRHNRILTNCMGRKYKFMDAWGDSLFKAAYSFNPQSTVADNVNWGIIYAYEDVSPKMQPLEILGQVHDSILFQYPIYLLPDLVEVIRKIQGYMEPELEYMGRSFTIKTDMKAGFNWGELEELELGKPDDQLEQDLKRLIDKHGKQATQ